MGNIKSERQFKSMKKLIYFLQAIFLFVFVITAQNKKNYSPEISLKVNALVSKMSIEEKVGQMTQLNLDVISKGEI